VLVLLTDQHSPHVAGCYGDDVVRTPTLDGLAADGMRFTNAYCPAPVCVPSRMSFVTSRYPSNTRVWNNQHLLSSSIPTWPQVMGTAGYETALVGRMHFEGPDLRHGFEHRPLGELSATYPGVGPTLWSGDLSGTAGQHRRSVEVAGVGPTKYQWFDDRVTEAAVEYLEGQADADRPFAAVVGYLLPHCPFIAPRDLFEYYYDRVTIPEQPTDQPDAIERFRADRDILEPLPEERIRVARAAYYAMTEYVDRRMGTVLEALDRAGLAEDTLVVYASDHGEMAGEHGCWWKSTYYEGSAGVPLIARLPGEVPAGSVSDAIVNLTDLGPTSVDGQSIWPTMRGDHPGDWTDETFSEFFERRGVNPSRMIRSGRYKLWDHPLDPDLSPALFDLEADPDEEHDLADDPEYADVRDRLLSRLHEDWNPEWVAERSTEKRADYAALETWGERVEPTHPDDLLLDPPDFREEIELR
jgi:choline-sulfatase